MTVQRYTPGSYYTEDGHPEALMVPVQIGEYVTHADYKAIEEKLRVTQIDLMRARDFLLRAQSRNDALITLAKMSSGFDAPVSQEPVVTKGWQPISTAPKAKTPMIVVRGVLESGYVTDPWCVWWQEDKWQRWPHTCEPTMWMALPSLEAACRHEWVSGDNQYVSNMLVCLNCQELRQAFPLI